MISLNEIAGLYYLFSDMEQGNISLVKLKPKKRAKKELSNPHKIKS